ncbi:hypothetical protein [Daejeonella lutea]|uniref:N-terminal double-transmembrane domain-containing protein n=1 Tax=Daejeonella lutea TaxID=572036 RepID=A0A1T5ETH3_9SPHI|nr:hypothetical protein [Daejeonella lutea]SKB87246.1 hypothetical protein SAMN05661099_3207 [Daejeonella lutea]
MENWVIIILCFLVLAFICWKELLRKNKANLAFRLIASLVTVLALYFIARPLSFQRKLDPSKENTAVLLTEGYDKDSLAGLKNIPIYSAEHSIASASKNVKFIPDLQYFSRSQADINKIHILGQGLERHEMESLKNRQLIFHPGRVAGFHSVSWNTTVRSGERLIVQGSFKSESKRAVRILLRGLSTTLDSTEVTGNQTFELRTNPKMLDQAVYSLLALSGKDTLANEKIPVVIEAKTPLRILMLSSSPDFENKFLKNWLASEQYALAVRSAISKDKFSTEFLNMERTGISRLSPALLKNFDILIGDLAELSRLSPSENAVLQTEVSNGLGLVIRADSAGGGGFYRRAFNLRQTRAIDQKNHSLIWPGQMAKKTSAPTPWAMEILPLPGDQPLVRDNKNHILVSSKLNGSGRMIATTVNDTYSWMLNNNSADYTAYWSHILGKAARRTQAAENWEVLSQFPVVNSASELRLESPAGTLPLATANNIPLHFAQDPIQSYRWTAKYWPTEPGWQSIRSGKNEYSWYVFGEDDWQEARAAEKIEHTRKFIDEHKTLVQNPEGIAKTYMYVIPAVWFYILFLVGMGYLWWEGKMN